MLSSESYLVESGKRQEIGNGKWCLVRGAPNIFRRLILNRVEKSESDDNVKKEGGKKATNHDV